MSNPRKRLRALSDELEPPVPLRQRHDTPPDWEVCNIQVHLLRDFVKTQKVDKEAYYYSVWLYLLAQRLYMFCRNGDKVVTTTSWPQFPVSVRFSDEEDDVHDTVRAQQLVSISQGSTSDNNLPKHPGSPSGNVHFSASVAPARTLVHEQDDRLPPSSPDPIAWNFSDPAEHDGQANDHGSSRSRRALPSLAETENEGTSSQNSDADPLLFSDDVAFVSRSRPSSPHQPHSREKHSDGDVSLSLLSLCRPRRLTLRNTRR